MEKYKTIDEYVAIEMGDRIVRKAKSPLAGLLVMAVGIVLLVLLGTQRMSDTLSASCLTVGIIALAVGIVLTAMCLTKALWHYVYVPTKSKMRQRKCYLDNDDYKLVLEAIRSKNYAVLGSLQPVTSSNSALSILYSRDLAVALLQAGHYDSNNLVPETPVVALLGDEVTQMKALCK